MSHFFAGSRHEFQLLNRFLQFLIIFEGIFKEKSRKHKKKTIKHQTHQFRHFTVFHVIMHTNIFFLFLWQVLPVFWRFVESIPIFFWIAFLAIFYLGMINQILLNVVLCQMVSLFFAENDIHSQRGKCNVGR